jgi:UDP-N-acetylglucosamine--N-acetylmuramyl-(pentapeptide) pyrophosphoryl-undecaprenol N-acetylglucosamine transferase
MLDLPVDGPVLGVFGGLAGARRLNELAVETWGGSGPAVFHVSGERDLDLLAGRVDRPDYRLVASTEHYGAALGAVDLAVSRAGGTVWELAAAGLPAILVPYPFATADHQTLNARYFEDAGGAITVPESRMADIPGLVEALLGDAGRLDEMRRAMTSLARPDAAAEIADELVSLARGGA